MSKIFRRSEYEHALNLARKARRQGDIGAAERWLKHADRHLTVDDRLEASIHATRLRDADMALLRAGERAESKDMEKLRLAQSCREMQAELDDIRRTWRENPEELIRRINSVGSHSEEPPSNSKEIDNT